MKKKILYADYNPGAEEYAEWFKAQGVEVSLATSSPQAYKLIQQQNFDAVIIDGGTNDYIQGKLLSVRIGEEFPNILRICYTGTVSKESLNEYMNYFDGVVSKIGEKRSLEIILKHIMEDQG